VPAAFIPPSLKRETVSKHDGLGDIMHGQDRSKGRISSAETHGSHLIFQVETARRLVMGQQMGLPVYEFGRSLLSGAQGIDWPEGDAAEIQLVDNSLYFKNIQLCCVSANIRAAREKNCIKGQSRPGNNRQ
jgi:hypothetical protein